MEPWLSQLRADPLPWLLEASDPAVRHATLRTLLGRPADDPEVATARAAAMACPPISAILGHQEPDGYWLKPGAGYGTKYRGTTWQLIFLGQLMADANDARVRAACEYVLAHTQSASGGFSASGAKSEGPPPPSLAIHCLNGNLLAALIGFGWLHDRRTQAAIEWEARTITGEGAAYYQSGTCAAGFACAGNAKKPCAWGTVKAMLGLGAIPCEERSPLVQQAIDHGREFLLSTDPATADYPRPSYARHTNRSWFKLGFPSAYVTDVLQNLEALLGIGAGGDARLQNAVRFVISKQDERGRWANDYAYHGKLWADIEAQGQPSKWVTLRACRVLKSLAA